MSQPTCIKCKRFLSRTLICTFCGLDNGRPYAGLHAGDAVAGDIPSSLSTDFAPSTDVNPAPAVPTASVMTNGRHTTARDASDIVASLSDVRHALSSISASMTTLDGRIASLESGLSLVDRIDHKLDSLDREVNGFETALRRLGDVERAVERLVAVTNSLSADIGSLSTRHVALEERLARLETVSTSTSTSAGPSSAPSAASDGLTVRFERMINEHRDHELIIFGIPIFKPEDPVSTVLRAAASLDVPLTSSEVVSAFRIGGRVPSSGPIVVKLITIARRNELLAKFRRRVGSGFAASNVDCSWPSTRVYLYELRLNGACLLRLASLLKGITSSTYG
ncbi:Uncharacterized protein DBV15_12587 [Temnothorax longispinosus]|uniref:Uncharacterized protein n=1 Tax=Temnothorax longispinosus TaxID=300112 RepID=A0A4S2KR29_9HYME|nr:Uncharacterized protein DBV15_12587 [Temnothorax longispinosus]